MKVIYVYIIVAFSIQGSESVSAKQPGFILNQELFAAHNNYDKSYNIKRLPLLFTNTEPASNCSTYFQRMSKHKVQETVNNQDVRSEYLICDALKILSETSIKSIKNTSKFDFGNKLSSRLDLRSFPSSLFSISDEENHTLNTLFQKKVNIQNTLTTLELDDWFYELEVVAVAYINNNKIPDWIVWVSDVAQTGNYRGYGTLIVYDPGFNNNFIAVSYP